MQQICSWNVSVNAFVSLSRINILHAWSWLSRFFFLAFPSPEPIFCSSFKKLFRTITANAFNGPSSSFEDNCDLPVN